jgi:hypothetical protein
VLHDGELRELNPFYASNSFVPATPVKFNVIRGVAIYQEREAMHGGYETLFCINTRQTNYPFNKMEIRALLYLKICLVGLSMTSVIKEPIFKDSRVTAVM